MEKPTYQDLEKRIHELEKEASALKKTEKALKDREEFLQTVINHIPHQVFWKDKDLYYLGCNQRFANVVGLDNPQQIVGMTDYDFNRDKTHAKSYRDWDRRIIDSGKAVIDLEENFHDDTGNEGVVLTSKVPVYDSDGNCICLVGICTDITERKQIETAIKEAHDNVKILSGLLPICASCNKIRDDKGYWNQVDHYIETHSEAQFSHGMCPECADKFYGDQEWYVKSKSKLDEST